MVAVQGHLERAPITEAVIDLRIRREEPIPKVTYENLHKAIRTDYPKSNELHVSGFQFRITDPELSIKTLDHKALGYRYISKDKTYVAQFRDNGFTLSRLEPYQTWEILKDEAARLWDIYCNETDPEAITRIAVRYINRIVLQFVSPKIDLEDYFLMVPSVPPELPQATASMLTQLKLHDLRTGAASSISISTQNIEGGALPVVFDIDVFKGGEFNISERTYWDALERLRELKNRIFFGCITDKTLELIR
jgi:uncharacterized protein (TIGR04255 family)